MADNNSAGSWDDQNNQFYLLAQIGQEHTPGEAANLTRQTQAPSAAEQRTRRRIVNVKKPKKPTICKASFGTEHEKNFIRLFRKGKIRWQDKYQDAEDRTWLAVPNRMKWFLKKGDELTPTTKSVSHSFYHYFDQDWNGTFSVDILRCEDDDPPSIVTENVKRMSTIDCNLGNHMSVSKLPDHTTKKGKVLKRLDFDIVMTPRPSGRSVNFEVVYTLPEYLKYSRLQGEEVPEERRVLGWLKLKVKESECYRGDSELEEHVPMEGRGKKEV